MQFLEATSRKELQSLAKAWGIKANIRSDEIREQLLSKGFTAPSPAKGKQPENRAPSARNDEAEPSSGMSNAETKLQGLQSRMKMRRNALHVRNGDTDKDAATEAADTSPAAAADTKYQQQNVDGAAKTPARNRASALFPTGTASKYFTPAQATQSDTTSCATVFGTPAQTPEPDSQSSRPAGARGIPSSPPPPPAHLVVDSTAPKPATPQRATAGIPSKRSDISVATPSTAQPAPAGPSFLPRSPVNSISGESLSPQPPSQIAAASPSQPANHIADVPATAAALQRLKNARTGNRPAAAAPAAPVPSHLLSNTSEPISQGPVASGIPASSPKKPATQFSHGAAVPAPSTDTAGALASSDDPGSDAARPSSSTSAGKAPRQVPVHLKKKASGSGNDATGSKGAGDTKPTTPTRPVRDTLGLARRRKAMHAQPGKTAANATVPPVPPRSMRSRSGQSTGKAKSVGAGAKVGDLSPPMRISRSPAPKRGVGGRVASAKRTTSTDRAYRRGESDDGTDKAPQRRSISVEPQPLAKSRPRVPRGSGIARKSASAIESSISNESSRDQSISLSKESSKASVGTTSAPGSVAASLLGGSLADRIGRNGTPQRVSTGAKPAAHRGSGLPRRSKSPFSTVDTQPRTAVAPEHPTPTAQADPSKGSVPDISPSVGSRLPRLSPSPSSSPSPTKHQLRAQLAAVGEAPSGGFVFPAGAARAASVDTLTFAEPGDDGESFAFGEISAQPADSTGLPEWQNIAQTPQEGEAVPSRSHDGDSSTHPAGQSGSQSFASRLDQFTMTQSPASLHLPNLAGPLPPVSEAATASAFDATPTKFAGKQLSRSKSGRTRLSVDGPIQSQLKNRLKGGLGAPAGPSLAQAALAARAQRVSEGSAVDSRSRMSSATGNDTLLAQYASTDMSSDAGGLSRVNTGGMEPSNDNPSGIARRQRSRSPLSASNPALASPAVASLGTAAAMAAAGRNRGPAANPHAHVPQRGYGVFATGPAGDPNRKGGASRGSSDSFVAENCRGNGSGGGRDLASAFEDVAGKVWNTSTSDMDGESVTGMAKHFRSSSTADGVAGTHAPLGYAASAGAGTLPAYDATPGKHSRNHSTSTLQQKLSVQPHMQTHRSSRLEDTAQWLTMRNRELQDLEVTMHELNQIMQGSSDDLPVPANTNPGDGSAFAGNPTLGTQSSFEARAVAGGSGGTPRKAAGASASMVMQYAEMEAELAQLPMRRRRTGANGVAPSQMSVSMDGFLMAERLANGAQQPAGLQQSASMPGQSAQQASACSSSQFTSSDGGSTMGAGSSGGSGTGGLGLPVTNRGASRSPMGRIGKPSVGSMLSPLPEKGKWAEPVQSKVAGNWRPLGAPVAESMLKQPAKNNGARLGLRAPKAGHVGARSRSANPAPFRGAASDLAAGLPRGGLTEANQGTNSVGVLAEPARPRPSGLTQSVGAGRAPGRVASAGSKLQVRMGGSMGTGLAGTSSLYLASPVASKTSVNRAKSAVGALRTPNVKPRSGTMACNRKR